MATQIVTKKMFIDFIKKQIDKDELIILTTEIDGELKYSQKRNISRVPFAFASDIFKNSVKHFIDGSTPTLAFSICPRSELSDKAVIKLLK